MKTNMIQYFRETVHKYPDRTAIVDRDERISYREFDERCRWFAAGLIAVDPDIINRPIAVYMSKSVNCLIADVGCIYSGSPYMNLDVKTPENRILNIIEQIKPAYVIADKGKNVDFFMGHVKVLFIEDLLDIRLQNEEELVERLASVIDTDPFCIINTSGSTGTPKGVVLNHRSFIDFINVSSEIFGLDGSEVMGSLSPVVFDIFDFELCMMMMNGSQIVLLDASLASFPIRLLEEMKKTHVNFIFWVPSIMVNIANMRLLEKITLEELKLVWFAGEVFPTKQFLYWFDHLSQTRFANLYGPIEITLDCTYYEIEKRPDESEPLPIGILYRNTDILILNDSNQKCAIGEEGELCVRGTSLSMGYYNNPEKTAEVFVQNPLNRSYPELIYRTGDIVYMREDGNIMFKGRRDSLIKHMGYRIELGEIEHVIENDLKLAEYCCAVYQYKKKIIVLYYESNDVIADKEFRKAMLTVFPSYMIPGAFIRMDALPRNTNGKIDRLMLKNKANEE